MYRILQTFIGLALTAPFSVFSQALDGQVDLSWYLYQKDTSLHAHIPTPEDILGFEVGAWHISHDQLVDVCETYAELSDRISMKVIGYTYEHRPLIHLYVTSRNNQQQLEELRLRHLAWAGLTKGNPDRKDVPLVINLGFSVHGNEASAMNASVLLLYYLAATRHPDLVSFLETNVIIIDPCLNPDGSHRFSSWVNMHRSRSHLNTHRLAREHREAWPGGRTNHYWFDLNRDWLLLRHPESRARVREFHRWKPNLLTDHHEMGSDRTFFFQPGIPSRNNPLTPEQVITLTGLAAKVHAEFLDQIGSRYYSEESYDDFYYGKGSTYPDVQGGVGVLFEQASARGNRMSTIHGLLSFPFAVRNQFTAALSSIEFCRRHRNNLLEYQRDFFTDSKKEAANAGFAGYYFLHPDDRAYADSLARLLMQHDIRVSGDGKGYFVPLEQSQYSLIRSMFDPATEFQDSLFYDVSTWMMPPAFGLLTRKMTKAELRATTLQPVNALLNPSTDPPFPERGAYVAYAFSWTHLNAPSMLAEILEAGFEAYISRKPLLHEDGDTLRRGTIVIPAGSTAEEKEDLASLVKQSGMDHQIPVKGFETGLLAGLDLGSPELVPARLPTVALVVGDGVSSYETGEIWYMLDEVFHYPVTLIEGRNLSGQTLKEFSHVILVSGGESRVNQSDLESWIREGGTLVTIKAANQFLTYLSGVSLERLFSERSDVQGVPYEELDKVRGAQQIGGMICRIRIDSSHPLAYGLPSSLSVFKNTSFVWSAESSRPSGWAVASYHRDPVVSGYLSDKNREMIAGTPAVMAGTYGQGHWISLVDDPVFRGYWLGSSKLLLNALFLSHLIE